MPNNLFIGVHIGVGVYNLKDAAKYEELINRSCLSAMEVLRANGTAVAACVAAVKVLEDDGMVNAGFGSNLTSEGTVECDASVMEGRTSNFGACGAVTHIKNPITLAEHLCRQQSTESHLGLIHPCILVGDGARKYAEKFGLTLLERPNALVSRRAFKMYKQHRRRYNNYFKAMHSMRKKRKYSSSSSTEDTLNYNKNNKMKFVINTASNEPSTSTQMSTPIECLDTIRSPPKEGNSSKNHSVKWDTVGAVCLDASGCLASASSSGGVILKYEGRISQVVVPGAGVWADEIIAVSTTGCGEHLMKTQLAREISNSMKIIPCKSLRDILHIKFINSDQLRNETIEKIAGAIVLRLTPNLKKVEFMWANTSYNLGVGYMQASDTKAKSMLVNDEKDAENVFRFNLEINDDKID